MRTHGPADGLWRARMPARVTASRSPRTSAQERSSTKRSRGSLPRTPTRTNWTTSDWPTLSPQARSAASPASDRQTKRPPKPLWTMPGVRHRRGGASRNTSAVPPAGVTPTDPRPPGGGGGGPTTCHIGNYGVQLRVIWETIVGGNKRVGEPRAELEKRAALRVDSPEAGSEVVDRSAGPAAVAVEGPVLVELEAGVVVVVKRAVDLAVAGAARAR